MMTFKDLQIANSKRAEELRRESAGSFTLADWGNAIAGETGELCNFIKKYRRVEIGQGFMNKGSEGDLTVLKLAMVKELADVVIYADLIASRLGLNLDDAIKVKFNEKSREWGSEVTL